MISVCRRRAVAYVQYIGRAIPACAEHARDQGLPFERITKLRGCEFEMSGRPMARSEFRMVIAEALPRCACGGLPEFCPPCARHRSRAILRPLPPAQ